MSISLLHLTAAAGAGVLLSGCMVMAPSPAVEAVNLISTVLVKSTSIQPGTAQDAVVHPHARIDQVCIELNPVVALPDFVPAVQSELHENGIASRLYDVGMPPLDCQATLYYTAFLDWDRRALNDDYTAYLSYATLTLRSNGRVLASSNYELGQIGLDKWSSTRSKISATVKALLAGN